MSLPRILCIGVVVSGAVTLAMAIGAQTAAPTRAEATTTELSAQNRLFGLVVFSSDGSKIGTIESVGGETDGRISAINVLTGSLLGLGTRVVAIPVGKFMRNDDSVQVSMTAEEVAKLPSVKDKV